MESGPDAPGKWPSGRSRIAGPWGTVLAIAAERGPRRLTRRRRHLPALASRQPAARQWPDAARAGALGSGRLAVS